MKVAMRITKLPLLNFVKFEESLLAESNLLLIIATADLFPILLLWGMNVAMRIGKLAFLKFKLRTNCWQNQAINLTLGKLHPTSKPDIESICTGKYWRRLGWSLEVDYFHLHGSHTYVSPL
ncbi:hypothetical protein LguiA_034710 [Lonicera macranthoides]